MDRPSGDIDGCRSAHERLATVVASVDDSVARRPSLLPDWSVGHVLTHLARNAQAACRRVEAAARGELVEQYVGGVAGRAAEIASGATRGAQEIVADTVMWANRLDEAFAAVSDDVWSRPVLTVIGSQHPVAELPFRRWHEVEVHMVDLGLGVTVADWSSELVRRALPDLLARLPDRADARTLTAWLLGRGAAPELEPWG